MKSAWLQLLCGLGAEFSGGSGAYLAIYAPNHPFEVSNALGEMWGAVVADQFILTGGSKLHYDEALGRQPGRTGKYSVVAGSWTELSF